MPFDFNDAREQSSGAGLIPPNSCVLVSLHIVMPNAGFSGSEPELTKSRSSSMEFLNTELVVESGKHAGAKIYHRFNLAGAVQAGQKKAVDISRSQIRAIIESHRRIDPADASPQATQARRINSYSDLEGMRFAAKVGCEPSNTPKKNDPDHYYVNNVLVRVLTPKDPEMAYMAKPPYEYISQEPVPEYSVHHAVSAPAGPAPAWAAPAAPAPAPAAGAWPASSQAAPPPPSAPAWGAPAAGDGQPFPSAPIETDQVPF
jgi:hypothetical protein